MPSQISRSIPITSICAFFVAAMAVSVPNNAARAAVLSCCARFVHAAGGPLALPHGPGVTQQVLVLGRQQPNRATGNGAERVSGHVISGHGIGPIVAGDAGGRSRIVSEGIGTVVRPVPRMGAPGQSPGHALTPYGCWTIAIMTPGLRLGLPANRSNPEMRPPGRSLCNGLIDRGGSFKSGQRERPLWRKPPPFPERGSKFAFDCNCNKRTSSFAFAALSDAAER